MDRISFTVPGEVVPWARAGGGMNKPRFTPARQRNYMAVLRDKASHAMRRVGCIFDGPVQMKIVAIYVWPKSTTKKRREATDGAWKTTKPDADNITKIVKDALNGIVFVDDAQVCQYSCWKCLGERAGLVVEITSLAGVQPPQIEV